MSIATSPRHLILRNLRREVGRDVATVTTTTDEDSRDKLPLPKLGDMQLYSFYKPSLEAGTYTIKVSQNVHVTYNERDPKTAENITKDEELPLGLKGETTTEQSFEVVAPQFTIDPKDIHSTYPPQGHADQPNVLPHIVFNDPHLPWERSAPGISEESGLTKDDAIPWLAVFPFDCNGTTEDTQELRLTPDQLAGLQTARKQVDGQGTTIPIQQSSTFTVPMTVSDYLKLSAAPVLPGSDSGKHSKIHIPAFENDPDYQEIVGLNTPVEVIFLSAPLFRKLFPLGLNGTPDVAPFRHLAHVRNVNTAGMVQASAEDAESGLFSIIHSKRTGPVDVAQNTAPRPQVVHMISLEYVDQMKNVGTMDEGDLVAFISLYRWNYLCQPPLTVNFVDAMRNIGDQMKDAQNRPATNLLRCPESLLDILKLELALDEKSNWTLEQDNATVMKEAMYDRLSNGFTMVRHRTASGEETVAFNRGPLIPVASAELPAQWPYASHFGQDYQIFDRNSGLMDISYSSAWQIGKLLASSDLGFAAALLRVRSTAYKAGKRASDQAAARLALGFQSKAAVLGALHNTTSMLKEVSSTSDDAANVVPRLRDRWSHSAALAVHLKESVKPSANSAVSEAFVAGVLRDMDSSSSAADTGAIFDETSLAASPDWAHVHSWIMDRLFLSGLPTHYYIGDPSFLPTESVRFFQVDKNWMDCFIDGALSVANHMAKDDDWVRDAIKQQLNEFFGKAYIDVNGEPLHYPQIPKYGFFLRSAIVAIFPDLTLDIPYPDEEKRRGRASILLKKRLGKDVLMVLLDRPPEELVTIKISQPPHQQRFSAGDALNATSLELLLRKVYREQKSDGTLEKDFFHEFGDPHVLYAPGHGPSSPPGDPGPGTAAQTLIEEPLYDWSSRCLDMPSFARFLLGADGAYTKGMPDEWGPDTNGHLHQLTSAMTGLMLNDTIKYLEIKGLNYDKNVKNAQVPHSIRVRPMDPTLQISDTNANNMSSLVHSAPRDPVRTVPQRPFVAPPATSTQSLARSISFTPPHLSRLAPLLGQKPHVAPVPVSPRAALMSSAANALAHDRSFRYAIFPSTSPFIAPQVNSPASNSYVFVDAPYVPDLIFSINIQSAAMLPIEVIDNGRKVMKSLWLREVQFKIPIGDPSRRQGDSDIPGLGLVPDNASAGLRGRMLDNQRWVIHLDPSAEYMVVRVIPRSTKLSTPVEWNRNLSFKLSEVDVVGLDVKGVGEDIISGKTKPATGLVQVRVSELYGFLLPDGKTWVDQGRANWSWKFPKRVGFASGWRPDAPT